MNQQNLVLYFPYRQVGGVSTLFLRVAECLKHKFKVYLVDFEDGYMAKHLPEGVELIKVAEDMSFPEKSTFLFQAHLPWRFRYWDKVSDDSKLLFWSLHPKNMDYRLLNEHGESHVRKMLAEKFNEMLSSRKQNTVKAVEYLVAKNAFIFMDRENVRSMNGLLNTKVEVKEYYPLPLPGVNEKKSACSIPLRFCWIGRIADFKYTILMHSMERLAEASKSLRNVEYKIVGTGPFLDQVQELAQKLENDSFKITFINEVKSENLSKFIVDEVDVLFAMGTSALEGARVGVPVFLTDYSYDKIKGLYRFSLLHENYGCCLTEEISEKHIEEKSSFEDKIKFVHENYEEIGEASYRYWQEYFAEEKVMAQLEDAIEKTEASFAEMKKLNLHKGDKLSSWVYEMSAPFRQEFKESENGFKMN